MKNFTKFNGLDPMSLKIVGDGEYVKREVEHLVDLFDLAEADHLEELRQDSERE